jgi:hypothetical protein
MSSKTKTKPDERAMDEAMAKGRKAATEAYPSAVIPIEYHTKPELGDAWYRGFMEEIRK